MKPETLIYQDYKPLYINGKRDAAKRYINNAGKTISVRQFQKNAHVEAGTVKQPARTEQETMKKFYGVVKRLGKGETLGQAAKAEDISPSTIRKINEQTTPKGLTRRVYSPAYPKVNKKTGKAIRRGFQLNASDKAPVLIIRADGVAELKTIECDKVNSSFIGRYWIAATKALEDGEYELLAPFEGKYVYDINGNSYELITDPATLEYAMIGLPEHQYKDIWSRFNSSERGG